MAKIKTDKTHLEHLIKIKRWQFNVLLIMCVMWLHLDVPFEIQRPQLNRNDSQSYVSSEPLIKDLKLDQTVTPNSSFQ